MHDDILHKKLEFPSKPKISGDCKDILKKLLQKEPTKRIGCNDRGASDIKKHKFFKKHLNWGDVVAKKLPLSPVGSPEHRSQNIPPSDVFGEYDDFEDESNIGNWSVCKTILDISHDLLPS